MIYLQNNTVELATKPLSVGMDIGILNEIESFGKYRK
jgi:hypothetical protein